MFTREPGLPGSANVLQAKGLWHASVWPVPWLATIVANYDAAWRGHALGLLTPRLLNDTQKCRLLALLFLLVKYPHLRLDLGAEELLGADEGFARGLREVFLGLEDVLAA